MALSATALIGVSDFWVWVSGERNAAHPGDDDLVEECINAATEEIERYCRRRWPKTQATITDEAYDGGGSRRLRLAYAPVDTVTAVKIVETPGDTPRALTADTEYVADIQLGYLVLRSGVWPVGDQNVLVSLKYGTSGAPAKVKLACRILAAWYWALKGRDPSVAGDSAGNFSKTRMERMDAASGLPLPVVSLLVRDRRTLITSVESSEDAPSASTGRLRDWL